MASELHIDIVWVGRYPMLVYAAAITSSVLAGGMTATIGPVRTSQGRLILVGGASWQPETSLRKRARSATRWSRLRANHARGIRSSQTGNTGPASAGRVLNEASGRSGRRRQLVLSPGIRGPATSCAQSRQCGCL